MGQHFDETSHTRNAGNFPEPLASARLFKGVTDEIWRQAGTKADGYTAIESKMITARVALDTMNDALCLVDERLVVAGIHSALTFAGATQEETIMLDQSVLDYPKSASIGTTRESQFARHLKVGYDRELHSTFHFLNHRGDDVVLGYSIVRQEQRQDRQTSIVAAASYHGPYHHGVCDVPLGQTLMDEYQELEVLHAFQRIGHLLAIVQ